MTDQNRWSEDRYGDRYRQDDDRDARYRAGDPYGRNYGQDRYADRGDGQRPGQAYGGSSAYEDRSFGGERSYEPYGAQYGEELYRNRQYGTAPQGYRGQAGRGYDNRPYEDRGAALHQGYRAPFGGVHGDAQGYDNRGYNSQGYGRPGYTEYRPDDGRGNFGAFGYASASRVPGRGYSPNPGYGANGDERGWWDQTRDEVSSWFGDDQAAQRRQFDEARHGVHRGRGPKGYTRSDDRIREDVNDRLTDDHHLDASDVEVRVSSGEVTLTGHVAHRDDKRRAEDLADRVAGVKHVQNNLRVQETSGVHASPASLSGAASTTTAAVKSN